jgi:hypothetical protein
MVGSLVGGMKEGIAWEMVHGSDPHMYQFIDKRNKLLKTKQ